MPASPLAGSRQALVVLAQGWDDLHATLQRYERTEDGWRAVGTSMPCVLGDKGLAWGRGLVAPPADGPRKREGDRKSPAGVFTITGTFGFAAKGGTAMPYTRIREPYECVDDARSRHYNTVVDGSKVAKDWKSSEHMRRIREYRWGAFVGHNASRPQPGAGSCIFLHIWDNADEGTAGCTALDEANLLEVLAWMRPQDRPLLVQMPSAAYASLRQSWGLP